MGERGSIRTGAEAPAGLNVKAFMGELRKRFSARGKAVAIRLRGPKCDDLASKNERAEGHLHPNKRVWLACFGGRVSLAGSNVAIGDCSDE